MTFDWVLREKLGMNEWKEIRCQGSSMKSKIGLYELILYLQIAVTQFLYTLIL